MTNLSVNINKVATIRNARGGNVPNVEKFALDCERFGADGITVHPRPDERHIKQNDVFALKPVLKTEFNIEGYPSEAFMDLVCKIKPAQVTLVPDAPDTVTSNHGWDVEPNIEFLTQIVDRLKEKGIRTSIFVNPDEKDILLASRTGAVAPYVKASTVAHNCGLGVNAGHDLNLENLAFFRQRLPYLNEVSIGHALISDALYLGIEETIKQYKNCLK